jgi:FG-GAP-like repeat/FG-GAP repeat
MNSPKNFPNKRLSLLACTVLILAACGGQLDLQSGTGANSPNASSTGKGLELDTLAGAATMPDSEAGASITTDTATSPALKALERPDLTGHQKSGAGLPFKADPASTTVLTVADFDGDGKGDVLYARSVGVYGISFMAGTVTEDCQQVDVPSTVTFMGTGDFNGDGKADIVWRNMGTGAVSITLMNAGTVSQTLSVGQTPIALNVRLEGIGDFDGNGRADMLWRNQTTGRSVMSYHSADGSVLSWPVVSEFINPASTTALKVGDINGDGKSDIVWRNMSSGNVVISLMDGNAATWRGITQSPIATTVRLEAIGDFDGNGKADLLWRNTRTGNSLMSYHNADGSVASWPSVSQFINPSTTSAVAVGDFDADDKTDILWRNLGTGNSVISLMNGNAPNWQATTITQCPCGTNSVVQPTDAYVGVTGQALPGLWRYDTRAKTAAVEFGGEPAVTYTLTRDPATCMYTSPETGTAPTAFANSASHDVALGSVYAFDLLRTAMLVKNPGKTVSEVAGTYTVLFNNRVRNAANTTTLSSLSGYFQLNIDANGTGRFCPNGTAYSASCAGGIDASFTDNSPLFGVNFTTLNEAILMTGRLYIKPSASGKTLVGYTRKILADGSLDRSTLVGATTAPLTFGTAFNGTYATSSTGGSYSSVVISGNSYSRSGSTPSLLVPNLPVSGAFVFDGYATALGLLNSAGMFATAEEASGATAGMRFGVRVYQP